MRYLYNTYIHTCTLTNTYVISTILPYNTYKHIYIHTCTLTHTYAVSIQYIHTHMRSFQYICNIDHFAILSFIDHIIPTYIHICTHAYTNTHTHIYTHSYQYICNIDHFAILRFIDHNIHTYIHICTHTYAHIHTCNLTNTYVISTILPYCVLSTMSFRKVGKTA